MGKYLYLTLYMENIPLGAYMQQMEKPTEAGAGTAIAKL